MTNQVEHTITTLKCFLADAAHELHTPITALNTNLELAATEHDDVTRQSFIERALEQLKRLETLTNNLLILSRIETHSLPDERHTVDLGALVRETSELYASQAEQMGITFMIDAPSEPTVVTANEAQLRRTLCNLLDNAIKFTAENGCVELGLRKDGSGIKLWVQDTGIGIPAEDMPYLFNRFHRGRNTAAYPGNGLGLAIIKAIVESHQGKVAVDSLSPGTRFTLLLPS
jgi:signal transduction histidine kinase